MKLRNPLSPSDFYATDDDKTKLNWFLFEFAAELQVALTRSHRRWLADDGVRAAEIRDFCIEYSKGMEAQILDQVGGKIPRVVHSYLRIEELLPGIDEQLADWLVDVIADAWYKLLDDCERCPTRCVTEKEHRAPMFDEPAFYE